MRTLLATTLLLLARAAAPAEMVALLPATGTNVHEAHLAAATDILRVRLEQTGRFFVVKVPAPAGAAEATPAQAADAARAAGATLAVAIRIARLQQTASVRLAAYRADGAVARVDELGAAQPDDLDPVLQRLAQGLASGLPARALGDIETVTSREVMPLYKRPAEQLFGMRLGAVGPVSRAGAGSASALSGGGLFWLYDARTFLADVSFGVHFSDVDPDSRPDLMTSLGMGVYRPFSGADLTPYAGGGVDYTWTRFGGAGASGLTARATGGVLLGRTSRVIVRAEAGWFLDLYAERDPVTGRDHYGTGPFASIGLATPY